MMKPPLFIILLSFLHFSCPGQAQNDMDKVFSTLAGQSENIIRDSAVKAFISHGPKMLPALASRFTDAATSAVFSKCAGRYLTHGELAIILADHIETMPYFTLTGLQNCTFESCNDNPNFVEYYLEFIRLRGMTAVFQQRYNDWLVSADRRKGLKSRKRS